jgi:hypothetical protein
MANGDTTGRVAGFVVIAASACNGQFDFDAYEPDTGAPVIVIEASTANDASNVDSVEPPRIGVHIACTGSDCVTPGCCSTAAGFACVDVSEGGSCGGLLIQCDDSDDCPQGQVCCAEGDDRIRASCPDTSGCETEKLLRVHCEPEAHCRNGGPEFVILCNPDRPSQCAQCETSSLPGLPAGYHQCATAP